MANERRECQINSNCCNPACWFSCKRCGTLVCKEHSMWIKDGVYCEHCLGEKNDQ
jgi:hypothetical protein